jgi:5-formyltetrahydrofolate cyclo-ligase
MRKPIPSPSSKSPKSEWRKWALEERKSCPHPPCPLLPITIALRVGEGGARTHSLPSPVIGRGWRSEERTEPGEGKQTQHILLYAATEWELDVLELAQQMPGKSFYLPRCAPKRRLAIHAYPCPLVTSRFGIREPEASAPEVSPDILDLVLVPALVLDERGFRLGYGGGYYDRFLPLLRKDCRTIGIAPFIVPELPTDPWDIPVGEIYSSSSSRGGWSVR